MRRVLSLVRRCGAQALLPALWLASHRQACLSSILALTIGAFAAPRSDAAPLLKVEPLANHIGVEVRIDPSSAPTIGLLEVMDAQGGRCLRTAYAGSVSRGQAVTVSRKDRLPAGAYRLRYREGIRLEYESSLVLPSKAKWVNPTDLAISGQDLYVYDAGIAPPPKKAAGGEAVPPKEEDENPRERTAIYKFQVDGKPATFGALRCIEPFPEATWVRNFTVDEGGQVYIGSGYHNVKIFAAIGTLLAKTIGGWDNDPFGQKCTGYVSSLAMGPNKRIYIPGYGKVRVYDRTKNGFEGLLGMTSLTDFYNSHLKMMASDPEGAVYILNGNGQLQRFDDNGKALEPKYLSPPDLKIASPSGPSASAGLIAVAAHGPGYGPFWDSGGGGEVLLFWDNGKEIPLVERYGSPGAGKDEKLEFLNPSATAITPDHLALWVVEDGLPNEDGPPGNARVRKFRIAADRTEEAAFEIR